MNVWQPLIFFDGEDEALLKAQFVDLSARHKSNPNFTAIDIARYVFRDLREPELRAIQAAERWSKDLDVQDKIRFAEGGNNGPGRARRIELLMRIAEDQAADNKDKIAAIMAAAALEGEVIKAIDKKVTRTGEETKRFLFAIDPDADKPPDKDQDDEDDE